MFGFVVQPFALTLIYRNSFVSDQSEFQNIMARRTFPSWKSSFVVFGKEQRPPRGKVKDFRLSPFGPREQDAGERQARPQPQFPGNRWRKEYRFRWFRLQSIQHKRQFRRLSLKSRKNRLCVGSHLSSTRSAIRNAAQSLAAKLSINTTVANISKRCDWRMTGVFMRCDTSMNAGAFGNFEPPHSSPSNDFVTLLYRTLELLL